MLRNHYKKKLKKVSTPELARLRAGPSAVALRLPVGSSAAIEGDPLSAARPVKRTPSVGAGLAHRSRRRQSAHLFLSVPEECADCRRRLRREGLPFVAQVSKPAVSPTSKSAGRSTIPAHRTCPPPAEAAHGPAGHYGAKLLECASALALSPKDQDRRRLHERRTGRGVSQSARALAHSKTLRALAAGRVDLGPESGGSRGAHLKLQVGSPSENRSITALRIETPSSRLAVRSLTARRTAPAPAGLETGDTNASQGLKN